MAAGSYRVGFYFCEACCPNRHERIDIQGETVFQNLSSQTTEYEVRLMVPLCPTIDEASTLGGSVDLSLTTDANGGSIDDAPGSAVWSTTVDGSVVQSLFHSPFHIGTTGAGRMRTSDNFGTPLPSASGVRHKNVDRVFVVEKRSFADFAAGGLPVFAPAARRAQRFTCRQPRRAAQYHRRHAA